MIKRLIATALLLLMSYQASAGTILVLPDINMAAPVTNPGNQALFSNILGGGSNVLISNKNGTTTIGNLTDYYSGLSGVTTTSSSLAITSGYLDAFDLLVLNVGQVTNLSHADYYSATERSLIGQFLAQGGNIAVIAETAATINPINGLLSDIGTSIQFLDTKTPGGFTSTSEIVATAMTVGVSSLDYAYASYLTGGTTAATYLGQSILAFETTAAVPIPATAWLLGSAIGALGWSRRRNRMPHSDT